MTQTNERSVIALTPGRCAWCGRFVARDEPACYWSVTVSAEYRQTPRSERNVWGRTLCPDCRVTTTGTWRVESERVARDRARRLGQEPQGKGDRRG